MNRSSGAIKSGGRNKRLVKVENVSLEGISIINLNHYVIILFYIDATLSSLSLDKAHPGNIDTRSIVLTLQISDKSSVILSSLTKFISTMGIYYKAFYNFNSLVSTLT